MNRERRDSRFTSDADKSRPVRRREKYTRRACETCKTRKVKCSGLVPCSRCVELRVECIYQDSFSESASEHLIASGHVAKRRRKSIFSNPDLEHLVLTMRKVCDDIESSASNYDLAAFPACSLKRSRRHVVSRSQKVVNPAPSYAYLLGLARDVLEQNGFVETRRNRTRPENPATADEANATPADDILRAAKPILHLGHDKALQYFSTFTHHIYSAYPCISLGVATERMSALYSARTPPEGGDRFQDLGIDLIDVEIMKVTFAIAMVLEGENGDPLCRDLTTHLLWNVDNNINEERAQVEDVIMATLLTIYLTLKNQPLKAWRMIRFAATTCLELGLNREPPAEDSDQTPSLHSRDIFSCVYDLDKRCSFFANLPWTLQHKDIDPSVLSLDDRHPFLSAMLRLDRVHTEINSFNAAVPPSGSKETDEQTEIYDYRIQKLLENIFAKGLFHPHIPDAPHTELQHTMSSTLQLRANQVRMSAYMLYLSNSCDSSSFKNQAIHVLISLARSSVDVYLGMPDDASLLWRPLANRLLMGTISCMFLAACQNPGKYGPLCRQAFHTAINCLDQASYEFTESESEVWGSLDDLRRLGGKIQMPPLDESLAAEAPPAGCFDSITVLDGELDFSAEDSAQLCETTSQDSMSGLWDATSLWENQFSGFEMA